ncbi:MAG: ATP-binding protein [Thermodesulfobacteriota bacterium]
MKSLLGFFSRRTMGFKLTFIFVSVLLIPMVLLAYMSYRVIDSRLLTEAEEKIEMGMKSAWTEYYARGAQMRYGMLQASSMEEIKDAVARGDKSYLKHMMVRWKQMRPYVDIWAVTDAKGVVIARLNSDYSGDRLEVNGALAQAVSSGEPVISSESIGRDVIKLEGNEIIEKVEASGVPAGPAVDGDAAGQTEFLALMVVTPVLDDFYRPIGAIVTGDVLNNDDHIPTAMSSRTPGLFTTISMGSKRISTNLMDSRGRVLKGSSLPGGVAGPLGSGERFFGGWTLGGVEYISAFEPIRDFRGNVVGSLDVGMAKESLWAVQKENQKVIMVITLLGLSFSLVAAVLSTYEITKPLKAIKAKLAAFADGDVSARVECDTEEKTNDELTILARTFNAMMDTVSTREAETQKYFSTIEQKNRDFAALNDELKVKNEEIEVAYEETQSQTEELHAINEELKLLNEDLDRKNADLKRANRIIIEEENEIKKAKDKLRFIYDSIGDFILLVDYDHSILEANRHFTETFKTRESMVAGKDLFEMFGMVSPAGGSPVRRAIDTMKPVEAEISNLTGGIFTMYAYPFLDTQSGPGRAVVYIRDVTEQRMISQRLMQTDKLSSLGELVSGVAHELNNPLTGIMCFSELLMDENIPKDVKLKLKKINDASHRCKKIIDNLLTFARWKMPEKRFEDINKVIRESAELRAYQLKVDNISLTLDLDPEMPGTMLDESQLHQVFINLINNARDAIKEKGGRGWIKITSSCKGDRIAVKFEDSGTGIPDEVANRIFDPFFTTKEVGKGTGLGLSISYGIIHEHGGNIYASSTAGRGTTFVVELPVISQIGEQAEQPSTGGAIELKKMAHGKKVLVLDDEPILLDMLHETLGGCGFKVARASSGKDALDMIKDDDYDLIISDIKMPGIDGSAFYRGVKRVKPELLKKIIFISGDSLNKETQSFLKESGNHSLKKPFTVDELSLIISKVIC